ncbi:hypothetical protein EC958_0199 [Escherichia coli O25b:H4-ST131]|uniref:Uncharacterized protein n=1 Tax=Escherichia coli O25b:H4-ST131 TaxID=941322 RepID=A0AA36P052_ECOLX|nr:hypothetical protein EC958_0199 [Escherichia coli O25b:H4-ST131]
MFLLACFFLDKNPDNNFFFSDNKIKKEDLCIGIPVVNILSGYFATRMSAVLAI